MRALQRAAWSGCACLVTLAGCAGGPVAPGRSASTDEAPAAASPELAYDRGLRERVASALRQRQLGEAALAAELLTVLHPDSADDRERLADLRRQVDAAVAARLPGAAQAAQRGDLDGATQQYLAILALQPTHAAAADALRALERERNKRNYLGKFSRLTLTRRAQAEAEMPAPPEAAGGALAARNDLEHAALLAGDGEFDAAVALLEQRLAAGRPEPAARRLLADVRYRQAEALLPRDRAAALAALAASLRADPTHPRAAQRLRQLQQAERRGGPAAVAPLAAAPAPPVSPAR